MKTLSIILLTSLAFAAFIGVAYVVRINQDDDPLQSEKLGLQKVRILQNIESLKVKQEVEQRETAIVKAKLARQERIEKNQGVNFAAVALAMFWRLLPVLLFGTALTGGLVYAFTRRVKIESPVISGAFPRKDALQIAQTALTVANSEAMGKALAFSEDVTRARIADMTDFARAIRPGRETITVNQSALPAATEPTTAGHLPTFAEIFDSRELHGEMILGFENDDAPRLGKYEAVHSCLIYGLARSGKTSWLRGLTGQTILTEPESRFFTLDPHAARKDSLLGSLPKTKHFKAIDAEHPEPTLQALRDELRRRLLSDEAEFPPYVLLIDELNELARRDYKPLLVKTCEELSQQGRKVNMFLLAACQDLRQKKIGDFRESLSSAYFFKGKSNQVKAFLDDNDAAKLYRNNVNRHGVALFSAADEEPRLMLIPECKPNDLKRLERGNYSETTQPAGRGDVANEHATKETTVPVNVSEVNNAVNVDLPQNVVNFPVDLRSAADLTGNELLTLQQITSYLAPKLAKKEVKLTAIAEAVKADAGFLSKVIRGQKKLPEQLQQRLTQWIFKHNDNQTQEAAGRNPENA